MEKLMKLTRKDIYLSKDLTISLKDQTLFLADGGEGLHLWEASICLTRYCIKNENLFNNKKIIELGTGCGLLGIALLLKTQCAHLTFSDYQDSVLNNLKENISINIPSSKELAKRYSILKLDWRDNEKVNDKFDIIIGTELIYKGGALRELAMLIKKIMNEEGKCYISMPQERSMTETFLSYISEEGLKWELIYFNKINDEELFVPVLKNEKESKKLFEDLKKMNLILYIITHK